MSAKISEIFSSIQGEGLYTGEKQIFVRFFGCNLQCDFCDTQITESREYSLAEVVGAIEELYGDHHSISLTGGEPLLQVNFLQELLPLLKKNNYLLYLETNGTLHNEFNKIKSLINIVSMDIKLPSSVGRGSYWQEHKEFLSSVINSNAEIFIKCVICKETKQNDILTAFSLVSSFKRNIPVILQPNFIDGDLCEKMAAFKNIGLEYLQDVRLMRQEHKFLGVK